MTFSDKKMNELLGIYQEPIEMEIIEPDNSYPAPGADDSAVDADYAYARKNLRELIEKGMSDLESVSDIARQSESPRAYEVMNAILKSMVDANKDLLDLAKRKKDLKAPMPGAAPKNVNNNLFVGSTTDLQAKYKMIQDASNE